MAPANAISVAELDRYRDLSELLDDALALPADERDPWLQRLSQRQRPFEPLLRTMLARAAVDTGSFMQSPAALTELSVLGSSEPPDAPGQCVGPYRLLREIGRGGMATVWLAERSDGVPRRQVAIKLPHYFARSQALDTRMARERDILAALEHPHIARLYDAGFADEGRPYLAMEFVDGLAIDAYVRAGGANLGERLRLMVQVMAAVAHAHAARVVHNDLKPGNILVDRAGQARLVDFGVADLLYAHAVEAPPCTRAGIRACTPAYASPEQTRHEPLGVASDIYALGVVLHELLCGHLPGHAVGVPASTMRSLQVSDPRLTRSTRADLGAILATALHHDAAQRYRSVEQFAADIERHLAGEPVLARGTSPWYRVHKAMQRRGNASMAGAALVGALAGLAGGLVLLGPTDARIAPVVSDHMASAAVDCPAGAEHCVVQKGSKVGP